MELKEKIVNDSFDLEILSFINEENNITKISKLTGYTYKSVFHRIKKLEQKKFIIPHKTKDITDGITFSLNPEFKEKIENELEQYNLSKNTLMNYLSDDKKRKNLIDLLKYIQKNRFVSEHDLINYFLSKEDYFDLGILFYPLQICNWINMRTEITRKGKKIIKENSIKHESS